MPTGKSSTENIFFKNLNYIYIKCNLHTWGSMLGAMGWMTSWTGSDVDVGGAFLFWSPLPGGLGMTAVAEAGYRPWLSVSWYSAACLASASFFPTTNLGSGRSLTVEIESNGLSKMIYQNRLNFTDEIIRSHSGQIWSMSWDNFDGKLHLFRCSPCLSYSLIHAAYFCFSSFPS